MHLYHSLCTLDYHRVLRVVRAFTIGNPLGRRGSACVEVMTTLHGSTSSIWRRVEGCVPPEGTITFVRDPLKSLFVVPVLVQCPGLSWREVDSYHRAAIDGFMISFDWMDTQQSRHAVLEDTPSDLVPPSPLLVRMLATQTLHTISHDQATVIPPTVTPVTIFEDPRSLATLPVGFRMPEIERYTSVGCPRIHLKLYNIVMRALGLDEAQLLTLFPLSFSGTTQRWEKAAEMIERPTERDQMCMFFRSLQPRFAGHLVGIPRSNSPPSQHRHPQSVQQYPSMHPHTTTVRPLFQFHRPQTSTAQHEQSRPLPLAPRPPLSTLSSRFLAHEFCAFHQMAGHRTDYCASLRHTIQDLIDNGVVSFPVSTIDTNLDPDMTVDSFPTYSTHAVLSPSGLYHHVLDTQDIDIHKTP
ncbi:hypothetical protein CK203_060274 [Vitis vinifera]|uniref:Retrotransposon gag domain-containing protein n=1 Tax=Vitis vinifera TaxID=29760 RepID=A0A438GLS4_VITVI|nr:hypothetical protein CK203_060274 [Vitis vinifera]